MVAEIASYLTVFAFVCSLVARVWNWYCSSKAQFKANKKRLELERNAFEEAISNSSNSQPKRLELFFIYESRFAESRFRIQTFWIVVHTLRIGIVVAFFSAMEFLLLGNSNEFTQISWWIGSLTYGGIILTVGIAEWWGSRRHAELLELHANIWEGYFRGLESKSKVVIYPQADTKQQTSSPAHFN